MSSAMMQKPILISFCPATLFLLGGTYIASLVIPVFGVKLISSLQICNRNNIYVSPAVAYMVTWQQETFKAEDGDSIFPHEHGNNIFILNVGIYLQVHMMLQPRSKSKAVVQHAMGAQGGEEV